MCVPLRLRAFLTIRRKTRSKTSLRQACPLHLDYSQLGYTFIFRVTLNPSVARIELIPEGGPNQTTTMGKEVMVVYCREDQRTVDTAC